MTADSRLIGMTFTAHHVEGELFILWSVSLPEYGEIFSMQMDADLAMSAAQELVACLTEVTQP